MNALVIGGAACAYEDLAELETMLGRPWPWPIILANDIGATFPRRFDYWVSLHVDRISKWSEHRARLGLPGGFQIWGRHRPLPHPLRTARKLDGSVHARNGGSSSMLGVDVAERVVGATRVVLCGCPMDNRPHFAESIEHRPGTPWRAYAAHRNGWNRARNELVDVVRSMSGWTREMFGAPTPEFLGVDAPARVLYFDRAGRRRFVDGEDPRADVRALALSGRTRGALARAGVTFGEALEMRDDEVLALAGVGEAMATEIRRARR